MLQEHKAGERLFVDYAGQTAPADNAESGETRKAQVCTAMLGTSSYFYTEASWGQGIESWTGSHVKALERFGGSVAVLVPDNRKSGVTQA